MPSVLSRTFNLCSSNPLKHLASDSVRWMFHFADGFIAKLRDDCYVCGRFYEHLWMKNFVDAFNEKKFL